MSEEKRKIDYHEHDTPRQEQFPDISNVASANECTGLMYRTPINGAEWESLQQLSPMGIPKVREEMDGNVLNKLHGAETARETGEAVKSAGGEHSPGYSPRHLKQ